MSDNFRPCPNRQTNEKNCTCPKTDCANHGICCQCVMNHRSMKNLPRCLREEEA